MERSVLYVDPDPSDRQRFEEVAGEVEGLDVTLEESVESAFELLDDHAFDIVVSEAFTGEKDVDDLFSAARLSVIQELMEDAQEAYFIDEDLSKTVYQARMETYRDRLSETEEELAAWPTSWAGSRPSHRA